MGRPTKTTQRDRVRRLFGNASWGLEEGLEPAEMIPMLQALLEAAEPGSRPALFAGRHLARLLAPQNPWRAARLASDVLRHEDDAQAWNALGLAHTVMGNFRAARRAYSHAISRNPDCASALHNLGHLLDVAFDSPASALPLLRAAYRQEPDVREIGGSYAHALCRVGQVARARRVLSLALRSHGKAERLIAHWCGQEREGVDPDASLDVAEG